MKQALSYIGIIVCLGLSVAFPFFAKEIIQSDSLFFFIAIEAIPVTATAGLIYLKVKSLSKR